MSSSPPSQKSSDRKPLLPTHVHQTHRLSSPAISFPSSGSGAAKQQRGESGDQHLAPWSAAQDGERRPGIPKLTRECFISELWCYGKWVLLFGGVNAVIIALGLWVYFSKVNHDK